MEDYEKLGVFYLGKRFDAVNKTRTEELILYDSRDLLTHAVCVGMTGSGKTGLCIDLIEEAAIDSIPVIAIDPKGDLGNLLLTFPGLEASAFAPWIDPDECRRKGTTREELAQETSTAWRVGLEEWGQSTERIERLRKTVDFNIYTPASNAGTPVSILHSFDSPGADVIEDSELFREQVSCTATSILALLSIEADPLKSREHILLSTILNIEWKAGRDLTLHSLVEKITNPPIKQLGAMPLDSIFPPTDRFQFALSINNLLASPGFESWMEGEPLDIGNLLYSDTGKPKVSIISIAHLADSERMFFVSLLLTRLLAWVRRQSGTTSLRAILYMDEVTGYFPPVKNPPSKPPLLALLKQARAFGLGVVLATQNPVDLDYKALGNTGTWFIGRLQTERDKKRVLDGLETAADAGGTSFDRQQIDRLLSSLSRRVFLMNNVHEDGPVLFESRWSLSWLRGPLSRAELKALCAVQRAGVSEEAKRTHSKNLSANETGDDHSTVDGRNPSAVPGSSPSVASATHGGASSQTVSSAKIKSPPMLPPDITVRYAPVRKQLEDGAKLVYKPMLLCRAEVRFADQKIPVDLTRRLTMLTLMKGETDPINWQKSFSVDLEPSELLTSPAPGVEFADLPAPAATPNCYTQWKKDFAARLLETQKLDLFRCPITKLYSRADESEREFRIRLMQDTHEERDRQLEVLRKKYSDKLQPLQDRLLRAEQMLEKEEAEARQADLQSAVNIGASLFGAVMGRKILSQTNIRRATSAINNANRSSRQRKDVENVRESIDQLQDKIAQLELEFRTEMTSLQAKLDPISQQFDKVTLAAKKTNVRVVETGLCWAPCVRQDDGKITAAW